jgi:hypothetical protein
MEEIAVDKKPIILMIIGAVIMVGSLGLHFTRDLSSPDISKRDASTPSMKVAAAKKPLPEVLSYVPEDTIAFFGGLEPFPLKDVLKFGNAAQLEMQRKQWSDIIASPKFKEAPPGARMILGLLMTYSDLLMDRDHFAEKVGIPQKVESALYTVGIIPVLRVKLADPAAFTAFIEAAEKTGKVIGDKNNVSGVDFLSYSFDKPDSAKHIPIKLLIAQNQNYAVFSFDVPFERERLLGLILGAQKPEKALSGENRLQTIQEKYSLLPTALGYINHHEVINGLTQAGANEFGRMLDAMINAIPRSPNPDCGGKQPCAKEKRVVMLKSVAVKPDPFATIRTKACHKELMAIADEWPQTVFGYTNLNIGAKKSQADTLMVMESTNLSLMTDLLTLRGHIPSFFRKDGGSMALGVAVGLNLDAVPPFVTKMLTGLSQTEHQCKPLKDMQQQLMRTNPEIILRGATAVLAGIKGISLALLNVNLDPSAALSPQKVKDLDGIITVSAENPQALLRAARNMPNSPLAGLNIPEDGRAVPLPPLPMLPTNVTLQAAVKGKHIVIYYGHESEAAANGLVNEDLDPNGIFGMAMDYGKYFNMLIPTSGPTMPQSQQDQLDALKNLNMKLSMTLDFTKNGIQLDTSMTMH